MKTQTKPLPEELIWSFLDQLTQAIAHLHTLSILHRDIKPQNILLTKNNLLKLGDMGVSKIIHNTNPAQGTRVGTPLFLAPELIQQKPYDFKVYTQSTYMSHRLTSGPLAVSSTIYALTLLHFQVKILSSWVTISSIKIRNR